MQQPSSSKLSFAPSHFVPVVPPSSVSRAPAPAPVIATVECWITITSLYGSAEPHNSAMKYAPILEEAASHLPARAQE